MILTSFGAAEEVTGSKHLLEVNGRRILLDCGMFQGHREEADSKNRRFGFDPLQLDAVVISHAHIDHSGLLPLLVKRGYHGPIYMTPATRDLCALMLLDSAHIQNRDVEWLSRKHRAYVAPLYGTEEVQAAMRRVVGIPYELRFPLVEGVYLTFHDAGHILGSAMIELEYAEKGTARRFIFSGDIGRKNTSILKDPWVPREADSVLMESTYGDRDHPTAFEMEHRLGKLIKMTAERGGKVIIPTFALERAQEIIYTLKKLEMNNALPDVPIFVDSPLAVNVTHIFRLHTEAFDDEFAKVMREAGDPFQLRNIRYLGPVSESMELNTLKGPAVIMAAAGMCEHGRVLHHLKNHVESPENLILIVGFQAKHTLGRRIVERRRTIKVLGMERELNAQVEVMDEFSAHAGRSELIAFGRRFKECGARVMLAHGEAPALDALKTALDNAGLRSVSIQKEGIPVEI